MSIDFKQYLVNLDHLIVLSKLNNYGNSVLTLINLIKMYLFNRKQTYTIWNPSDINTMHSVIFSIY